MLSSLKLSLSRRPNLRTVVTLSKQGRLKKPLRTWYRFKQQTCQADAVTFSHRLQECGNAKSLVDAKRIHAHILRSGLGQDTFLGNRLIWTYDKCSSPKDAWLVFDGLHQKNLVSWNMMIGSYAQNEYRDKAIQLFKTMQKEGIKPDKVTFLNILNACSNPSSLNEGKFIHSCITRHQMESDIAVGTALVNMYGKCGSLDDACKMFTKMSRKNVVSWTAMIAAYAQQGCCKEAFQLLAKMSEVGVQPNRVTLITILSSCASPAALTDGKVIHSLIVYKGCETGKVVNTALLSMYGRCGSLDDARNMFDKMPTIRDVVLCSAMITAYAQHGDAREALQLFEEMSEQGIKPTKITFVSVLDACTSLVSLPEGKLLHTCSVYQGFESDLIVGNALVNMYSKCGSVEDACMVFTGMPELNVISWNAMIAANAQHGHAKEAVQLLHQMQQEGAQPDAITFIGVLSACSHAGMVDEACHYFTLMSREHGIKPTVEHYGCLVDLLGRVGQLEKAVDFIADMPHKPGSVPWFSLLGACRAHGNMEQGRHIADHVFELEPQNPSVYVMLSSIHVTANMTHMVVNREVRKEPASCSVEAYTYSYPHHREDILDGVDDTCGV